MDTEQEKYFGKRAPLPDHSSISVDTDGETLAISLWRGLNVQGAASGEELVWSAPEAKKKDVIWLAMSAAAFHNIPCYLEDSVLALPETL